MSEGPVSPWHWEVRWEPRRGWVEGRERPGNACNVRNLEASYSDGEGLHGTSAKKLFAPSVTRLRPDLDRCKFYALGTYGTL